MSTSPSVIVDTSVLRTINLGKPGPEIGLLSVLCGDGKLTLIVPEVAWNEWKTQLAQRASEELESTIQILRKLARRVWMSELEEGRQCSSLAKTIEDARDSLIARQAGIVNKLPFRTIHITHGAGKRVMDAYFAGKPPFAKPKERKDIPDAFILDACRSYSEKHPNSIFVCKDAALCSAVGEIGMTVVNSFSDLLKLEEIRILNNDPRFAHWWTRNFGDVVKWLEKNENELADFVSGDELVNLDDLPFWVPDAPPRSKNFSITRIHKVYSVEFIWEMAQSSGEGILRIPMKWNCEVDINFQIPYFETGYSMPWYSIDIDGENQDFANANGDCELEFHADILIGYQSKPNLKEDFSLPISLKIENISHADTFTSGTY